MSCFDLRLYRSSRSPISSTNTSSSSITSFNSPSFPSFSSLSFSRSRRPRSKQNKNRLPQEHLSDAKLRLICIRRQQGPIPLQVGFKSRTGWQLLSASKRNQDAIAVLLPLSEPHTNVSLFAVFDAHGRNGHLISSFVAQRFSSDFHDALTNKSTSVRKALHYACLRTAAAVQKSSIDSYMTGTTLTTAVIHDHTITCANLGDSRIVAGTMRDNAIVPVALTRDHVPSAPSERKRMEAAGGRVEKWGPKNVDTGPARIWLKEKRLPGLSISRSIGDSILNGIVISEPDISSYKLSTNDKFIVVASDGIWNVMTNEQVVQFVATRSHKSAQRVAEALVRHAATLWHANDADSIDDISVIVVWLKW